MVWEAKKKIAFLMSLLSNKFAIIYSNELLLLFLVAYQCKLTLF